MMTEKISHHESPAVYGARLAHWFLKYPLLLLDMDGVVVRSNSLHHVDFITPRILPALQGLETGGVKLGVATARGFHIMKFLRSYGLTMDGPAILEEGQVLHSKGEKISLVSDRHLRFTKALVTHIATLSNFRPSWDAVRMDGRISRNPLFCLGDVQWQGESRTSLWFADHESLDDVFVRETFLQHIRPVAARHGLSVEKELSLSVNRMVVEDLGFVTVKAAIDGMPFNKSFAALNIKEPFGFIADGIGDEELGQHALANGGIVVAVGDNLDKSSEPERFKKMATMTMQNSHILTESLLYTADFLSGERPRIFDYAR